jgi:uncharacterized protein (TIGR03435 family)
MECTVKRIAPLFVLLGMIQADEPKATRPEFEVASIKPHTASDRRVLMMPSPGGTFNASGVTLRMLMNLAYRVQDYQISGGPGWIDSDRYDIAAKADDDSNSKLRERVQALLEDRFKLAIRRETREVPIYALVIAKGGPKLLESDGDCPPHGSGPPPPPTPGKTPAPRCGGMFMGRSQLSGLKIPLPEIVTALSRTLGRPVIDQTGLTGKYDIKLEWTPDKSQVQLGPGDPGAPQPPPSDTSGPSIYTALQEQLGLKLESQKGPVEVLTIDHVEHPSEN